jgi:hypothetical protein
MTPPDASRSPNRRRPAPLLSSEQCRQIAAEFDGTTETIDRLLAAWRDVVPGLQRHNIASAARRGGYVSNKPRKPWTAAEDQFLKDHWHMLSGDEIARQLGRTFTSVNLRRKRLGIVRYDGDELTIRDLEALTRLDHRQWHEFIEQGWLRARQRARRRGATPITYVSVPALHDLLRAHPEVLDYRNAPKRTRARLELDSLPEPPTWKRVICSSDAWQWSQRQTRHRSCAAIGSTSFWSPLYSLPRCPRCGCQVSRYSPEGLFTNVDPEKIVQERTTAAARDLLPPALRARVSAQENRFLSLLGWRRDELNRVA